MRTKLCSVNIIVMLNLLARNIYVKNDTDLLRARLDIRSIGSFIQHIFNFLLRFFWNDFPISPLALRICYLNQCQNLFWKYALGFPISIKNLYLIYLYSNLPKMCSEKKAPIASKGWTVNGSFRVLHWWIDGNILFAAGSIVFNLSYVIIFCTSNLTKS